MRGTSRCNATLSIGRCFSTEASNNRNLRDGWFAILSDAGLFFRSVAGMPGQEADSN